MWSRCTDKWQMRKSRRRSYVASAPRTALHPRAQRRLGISAQTRRTRCNASQPREHDVSRGRGLCSSIDDHRFCPSHASRLPTAAPTAKNVSTFLHSFRSGLPDAYHNESSSINGRKRRVNIAHLSTKMLRGVARALNPCRKFRTSQRDARSAGTECEERLRRRMSIVPCADFAAAMPRA